jgi:hypothetical protein
MSARPNERGAGCLGARAGERTNGTARGAGLAQCCVAPAGVERSCTHADSWGSRPRLDDSAPHQLGMACAAAGRHQEARASCQIAPSVPICTAPPPADTRRRAPSSGWPSTATRSTPRARGLSSGWSPNDAASTDTRTFILYFLLISLAVAAESTYIANGQFVVVHIPSRSPGRQTFDRLVER